MSESDRSALSMVGETVSSYCESRSDGESEVMAAIAAETKEKVPDLWIMMVGPLEARLLANLVRMTGAKRVLELGTFTGYSALAIAQALPADGTVMTLDVSETYTEIARRHWAHSPHRGKIDLRLGPGLETLEAVDGPIDLAFLDADKENYPHYWDKIVPKMRTGGVIAVDNVLANGEAVTQETEFGAMLDRFNQKVAADERVDVLMLPFRDGVTLAVKRD